MIFQQKENGDIHVTYADGTIDGLMEGNTLKAVFHNPKVNISGLMELIFHETGFEGRWKKGTEPGELKQKWNGVLVENSEIIIESNTNHVVKGGFHTYTDEDGIRYEGKLENLLD